MRRHSRLGLLPVGLGLAVMFLAQAPAVASTALTISGTDSTLNQRPLYVPCSGGVNECGSVQLDGLGVADWTYAYGPTFTPDGRCYQEDGSITLTLRADGSTVTGSLTGRFCPQASSKNNGADNSWGNPYVEDDTIAFAGGTGQFAGLAGDVNFHVVSAGAKNRVSFSGTLSD